MKKNFIAQLQWLQIRLHVPTSFRGEGRNTNKVGASSLITKVKEVDGRPSIQTPWANNSTSIQHSMKKARITLPVSLSKPLRCTNIRTTKRNLLTRASRLPRLRRRQLVNDRE
jgi:hypothetical protein